jgi:putative chitinase
MKLDAYQLATAVGAPLDRGYRWLDHINATLEAFCVNTPARAAAFLAQVGHESGGLRYAREIWGPTPAQQRYEGRVDLGNNVPGDGRRYMGRGLIQVTGRANYRAAAAGLQRWFPGAPDFEAQPDLLELPQWAAASAGWYWANRGLNELADAGDFIGITRRINGGTNGLADRQTRYAAARGVLGVA